MKRYFGMMITMLASLLLVTACGKGGGGGSDPGPVAQYNQYGQCISNCNVSGTVIASGTAVGGNSTLTATIYGNQAVNQPYPYNTAGYPYNGYGGSYGYNGVSNVSLSGTLTINQNLGWYGCVVPAGNYSVTSTTGTVIGGNYYGGVRAGISFGFAAGVNIGNGYPNAGMNNYYGNPNTSNVGYMFQQVMLSGPANLSGTIQVYPPMYNQQRLGYSIVQIYGCGVTLQMQ